MKNWYRNIVAAGVAVAVLGIGMATNPAFADPAKDRQAVMKTMSKAGKALGKAAKGGMTADAQKQAQIIVAATEKLESMFPKGSGEGYGKTNRAKPEIWSDWAKFQKANATLKSAAMKVASGDLKAAGDIGKACGACHKAFRGPKPKKM